MAKSVKKAPRKVTRKTAKKAAKRPVKKAAKKVAKKAVRKVVKKTPKKAVRKATPKPGPVKLSGKRFLVIYHAPVEASQQMESATPEQQAEGMAMWMDWANKVGERLVDMGAPLMNGRRINSQREMEASTKDVTGYSVIVAEDLDHLLQLLESNPHISGWHPEATVEVHETMILPGM